MLDALLVLLIIDAACLFGSMILFDCGNYKIEKIANIAMYVSVFITIVLFALILIATVIWGPVE